MKRPTILIPVVAGFGVLLIILLAVISAYTSHIHSVSRQLTSIVSERNFKVELATRMHNIHHERFQSLRLAATLEDSFERDEQLQHFSNLASEFLALRGQFLELPLDESELSLWTGIRQNIQLFERLANGIADLIRQGRNREAASLLNATAAVPQAQLMAKWDQMIKLQQEKNREALAEASRTETRMTRVSLLLGGLALLIGGLVAYFVLRTSHRLELALFEEKQQATVTLESIGEGVIRLDGEGCLTYLNPVAEAILGIAMQDAVGRHAGEILRLLDRESREPLLDLVRDAVSHGQPANLPGQVCLLSQHGMEFEVEGEISPLHEADGQARGAVMVLRDVTEARLLQKRICDRPSQDPLTGAYNQAALEERLGKMLLNRRASDFPMSFLLLAVDGWGAAHTTAGQAVGDDLLRQLSQLIQSRIRDSDTLAHLGEGEFGIVLRTCPDGVAEDIADTLEKSIRAYPFTVEGRTYPLVARVGLVHAPPFTGSPDECLAAGRQALRRSA